MLMRFASGLILIAVLQSSFALGQLPAEHTTSGRDVEFWQNQLRDPAPSYRIQAITQLERFGDAATPALNALYSRLGDIEPNVRLSAIQALGGLGLAATETVTELIPHLSDADPHVQYAAEWAIGRLAQLPVDEGQLELSRQNFRQYLAIVSRREHHQRHREIVEEALAQIAKRQSIAAEQARVRAAEHEAAERQLLSRQQERYQQLLAEFEFGDRIEQLRIIELLAASTEELHLADLTETRAEILKQALLRGEFFSTQHAFSRWGDSGRAAVRMLFDALPQGQTLPNWTADILRETELRDARDLATLLEIANQPLNPIAVKSAAIDAMSLKIEAGGARATLDSRLTLAAADTLLAALQNPGVGMEFRPQALRGLGRVLSQIDGHAQQHCFDYLRSVQTNEAETWAARCAATDGLACCRPDAPDLAERLAAAANQRNLPSYELGDVLDIVRRFSSTGSETQALIDRALSCDDDLAREAACRSIGARQTASERNTLVLVETVCDPTETPAVRLAATAALAELGPAQVSKLGNYIAADATWFAGGETSQVDALNALASLGDSATPALEACLRILDNPVATPAVRAASAMTISRMGRSAAGAKASLQRLLQFDVPEPTRAAAIIALASTGNVTSYEISELVANHAHCGETLVAIALAEQHMGRDRVEVLADMLTSDAGEFAAEALEDIGTTASPTLLEFVQDVSRSTEGRLKALDVLTRIPHDDYRNLLSIVGDESIGPQCMQHLERLTDEARPQLLSDLMFALSTEPRRTVAARYEVLLASYMQGRGAGGEGDRVVAATAMGRGIQRRLEDASAELEIAMATQYTASGSTAPSAAISLPPAAAPAPALELPPLPSSSSPMGGHYTSAPSDFAIEFGNPSTGAHASNEAPALNGASDDFGGLPASSGDRRQGIALPAQRQNWTQPNSIAPSSIAPSAPGAPARAFQPLSNAASEQAKHGYTNVKVFYGTNRRPLLPGLELSDAIGGRDVSRKLLATLAAVATIAVCLFGFLRQNATNYALFAIGGLCFVAWFGLKSNFAAKPATAPERIAIGEYTGDLASSVSLGICDVSIPDTHIAGELEAPSILRFEFREDPKKHVMLKQVTKLDSELFFQDMQSEMQVKGPDLLVFIHGYNVSFEDAARRTAQLSHDLKFAGAPVFYSWPSQANWYQYQTDKQNIALSVGHIKQFLLDLAQKSGADKINLIAHSMGNVGLTAALAELDHPSQRAMFDQVVLAAPDIDADVFREDIAPKIASKATRYTLYTSSTDLALIASRYFNAGRRAGEAGKPILSQPGFDVIDASLVDTSLLGHSYYGGSASVLTDLGELLLNRPALERSSLTMADGGDSYWQLSSPDATRIEAVATPTLPSWLKVR